MKLEKIFEAKDGKLFKVTGDAVDLKNIKAIPLSWKEVEADEEGAYNEELLAKLREELKALEEKNEENKFVYISPIIDREASPSADKAEQFTAAMKHSARRLKDCISIVGFAIPSQIAKDSEKAAFYISEMSAKHAQYVFFAQAQKSINGIDIVEI